MVNSEQKVKSGISDGPIYTSVTIIEGHSEALGFWCHVRRSVTIQAVDFQSAKTAISIEIEINDLLACQKLNGLPVLDGCRQLVVIDSLSTCEYD